MIAEEGAVTLGVKPDQRRCDALQLFGGAFAGENVATQSLQDLERDRLLNGPDIGLGLFGLDDLFGHSLYGSRLIFSQSAMLRPNSAWTCS